MEPEISSGPLGAFFEPVRRRHPDVDIVVLPKERLDPTDRSMGEIVDDAAIAYRRDQITQLVARWWSRVVGEEAEPLAERLRFGTAEGTVVVVSRQSSSTAGPDALVLLASLVRDDGRAWRAAATGTERLVGEVGDLRVRASYRPSRGLVLEVDSPQLHVGRQRARELVRS